VPALHYAARLYGAGTNALANNLSVGSYRPSFPLPVRALDSTSPPTVLDARSPFLAAFLAVLCALVPAQASSAQSLWSKPYAPNQIALEVLQPSLDAAPGEDLSVLTGAATLWGSHLLTDRTTLVVGLPTARYASEGDSSAPRSVTEHQIGNPYVGLGVSSTRVPLLVELGLRLPLAPDRPAAARAGMSADLAHREAFAPDLFSTQALLNTRWELTRMAGFRFRGGPLLTVPTQEARGTTELFVRYGVQGWYEGDTYILGAGLIGRALVTERGGAFADRTTHQATGTLILNLPVVQPGVLLRVPINEPDGAGVDVVVGLTLSVTL